MRSCPCLDCGRLTSSTRCPSCRTAYNRLRDSHRGTTTARGYGAGWRKIAAAVLERDSYRCHWCGGSADTADHVIPKAAGGTDQLANVVAACRPCNFGRTARYGR